MDALAHYGSDDDDHDAPHKSSSSSSSSSSTTMSSDLTSEHPAKKMRINIAPDIDTTKQEATSVVLHDASKDMIYYNPRYEQFAQAAEGPLPAHQANMKVSKSGLSTLPNTNCWTGYIEDYNVHSAMFDAQYHTYMSYGFAVDPATNQVVGSQQELQGRQGMTVFENKTEQRRARKRARLSAGDPTAPLQYQGPWAKYKDEIDRDAEIAERLALVRAEYEAANPTAAAEGSGDSNASAIVPAETTKSTAAEAQREAEAKSGGGFRRRNDPFRTETAEDEDTAPTETTESSVFHGKEFRDYQGRTYISPPSELKAPALEQQCFLPKKKICTWSGHNKAVNAVRLFPKTGHILLSAGLDGKIKLWDVYNERKVLRTFSGHSKGVRDVCFSNDGRSFLSASYDRWVKHWDTETGECLGRFTNRKTPYCVKFNPDEDKQTQFIAGCSDKKIIQWDMRANEIVQEYDRHLGAVNTVTFIDNNRRFVSTSDDKSIRVWEWSIPVDIKYISEPHMHSMPAVTLHPNGKWLACQSLDNQILIYETRDRFKLNKKKRFHGHTIAGYACQVNFSPDGRFVTSGDGEGRLWIWDWKTSKVLKKLQCHDGASIGNVWHPIEPSRVITCGWDARIHYWD